MTEQRIKKIRRMLQEARYQIVNRENGIYARFGAPLYSMTFVAVDSIYRISTNGHCIFFDANWLQKLGSTELEFILAHELMHIEKGHIKRPSIYRGDKFHFGCDIIANANLIDMGYSYNKLNGIGKIYYETYFPYRYYGADVTPEEAFKLIPFDPATLPPAKRRQYMIDSEEYWDKTDDLGDDGIIILSPSDRDPDDLSLSQGIAEIVKRYSNYKIGEKKKPKILQLDNENTHRSKGWTKEISYKIEDLRKQVKSSNAKGIFDESFWNTLREPQLDWRKILNQFIQQNIYDYSFTPYDKRYSYSDFFLPSYNTDDYSSKDIVFMVDVSGSIEYDTLRSVYYELCSATEQFTGKCRGLLGTFNTAITSKLIPFDSIDDLSLVTAHGGGGTDFCCIFNYIKKSNIIDNIASIIIFTDGNGKYPSSIPFNDIPILWIISNTNAKPPFGTIARIKD